MEDQLEKLKREKEEDAKRNKEMLDEMRRTQDQLLKSRKKRLCFFL